MRIIAGRHRGRKLATPADERIRPTADRTREALFSSLETGRPPLRGSRFLDLCAGTGAIGLEAWSRGAAEVLMVENDPAAIRLIGRNLAAVGDPPEVRLLRADAAALPPADRPFDLAVMDPPYGHALAEPILNRLRAGWLCEGAVAVVELAAKEAFEPPPGYEPLRERRYGAARLVFLRRSGDSLDGPGP